MKTNLTDLDMVEEFCQILPEEPRVDKQLASEIIGELKSIVLKGDPKWLTKKEALALAMSGKH